MKNNNYIIYTIAQLQTSETNACKINKFSSYHVLELLLTIFRQRLYFLAVVEPAESNPVSKGVLTGLMVGGSARDTAVAMFVLEGLKLLDALVPTDVRATLDEGLVPFEAEANLRQCFNPLLRHSRLGTAVVVFPIGGALAMDPDRKRHIVLVLGGHVAIAEPGLVLYYGI